VKSPLDLGIWDEHDEVESTQSVAADHLKKCSPVGAVFAKNQTKGRGRFGREWFSQPGESLTMSLIFRDYADHPAPYLVGMATACAVAASLHCELQWPNDLVFGDKKLGGILTELLPDEEGRLVPVVGIGVNLNQKTFPAEIADRAISLAMYRGGAYDAEKIGQSIVSRLSLLPEPQSWSDLHPVWMLFDHTPGKTYKLPDGSEGIAMGVGPDGRLICAVNGESTAVLAAEAIFGSPESSRPL
jgi:BirA family transcriptional regulator, biotin operon repressor / biotin---[acetyl-CoA-carboxylase] ligase